MQKYTNFLFTQHFFKNFFIYFMTVENQVLADKIFPERTKKSLKMDNPQAFFPPLHRKILRQNIFMKTKFD